MKRFIFIVAFSLAVLGASAEIKFRNLDNVKGTNVVLVDENAPKTVEITDVVLSNNGLEYAAKEIRCEVVDGVATYRLKFKRLTHFKDCKVTLIISGKKSPLIFRKI